MKNLRRLTLFSTLLSAILTFAQETPIDDKYKRSSLSTLMISDATRELSSTIENVFINAPLIDKFNDHITNIRLVPKTDPAFVYEAPVEEAPKKGFLGKLTEDLNINSNKEDKEFQHLAILNYLNSKNIAKSMVAKWFNRSELGGFNMDLIAER